MNFIKVETDKNETCYVCAECIESIRETGDTTVVTTKSGFSRYIKGNIAKEIAKVIVSASNGKIISL